MKTEEELQTEVAAEAAAQPKKPTTAERIEKIEQAIIKLADAHNTLVQSLNIPQKQAPTTPLPNIPPSPQSAGMNMEALAPILSLLGGSQAPQENIFETLGKEMVKQFAGAYVKKAAGNMAKSAGGFKHEY